MSVTTAKQWLVRYWLLLVLSLALAGVRLGYAQRTGLWEDEAFGYFTSLGQEQLIKSSSTLCITPVQLQPGLRRAAPFRDAVSIVSTATGYGPVYYGVMYATRWLVPTSGITFMKGVNVLFIVLTGVCLWALARRGLSPLGAAAALLFYTFSCWDTAVGTQLKGYALCALCVAFATLCVDRLSEEGAPRRRLWAALYALTIAIGLLVYVVFLYLLPLHGAYVVLRNRCRWRPCLVWAATAFAGVWLVAPWFTYTMHNSVTVLAPYWKMDYRAGLTSTRARVWCALANNLDPVPLDLHGLPRDYPAAGLVLLVLVGASGFLQSNPRGARIARLAGLMYLGTFVIAVTASRVTGSHLCFWPRYYTPFLPFAWLAAGAAVEGLVNVGGWLVGERPRVRVALAGTACASLIVWGALHVVRLPGLYLDMVHDFRVVARELGPRIPGEDVIVHVPPYCAFLGLACYWDKPNLHIAPNGSCDTPAFRTLLQQTTAMAHSRSAWVLISWGQQGQEEQVKAVFAQEGYALQERFYADVHSGDPILVLNFRKNPPSGS